MTRPPAPLRPWWLWLEDRRHEVQLALDRHTETDALPHPCWLMQRGLLGFLLLLHPRNPTRRR
jgi:hypothetical protein